MNTVQIAPVFWECPNCGHRTTDDPTAVMRCCEHCKELMLKHNDDVRYVTEHGLKPFH